MSAPYAATIDAPADWDPRVLEALYELVFSTTDREVAGVLVGSPAEGFGEPLPRVRAAIPATQGFVTGQAALFTHQTWAHVHSTMARHYGGLETVGWYVSRPGRGTGLSEADMANHARWFGGRDQILLVVDSRSHRAAIYAQMADRLVQLDEGPVARRYTRPRRIGFPVAGVTLLAVIGMAAGTLAFLVGQAIGS